MKYDFGYRFVIAFIVICSFFHSLQGFYHKGCWALPDMETIM